MIKIGVEGNNTISIRLSWFGETVLFCPAPFHVYVLRLYNRLSPGVLSSTSVFYVYVSRSGYVPRFMVMAITWLRLRVSCVCRGYTLTFIPCTSLYKPNTTVLRYYICNQKILTMTSTHDTTIEMLNDLYLIVAGTDLSNSKINKTAIFAYLYQQIELQRKLS